MINLVKRYIYLYRIKKIKKDINDITDRYTGFMPMEVMERIKSMQKEILELKEKLNEKRIK